MDFLQYCHTSKAGGLVRTCVHSRFSSGIPVNLTILYKLVQWN